MSLKRRHSVPPADLPDASLKDVSGERHYLRCSLRSPWQVLSAEKQVGWSKTFSADALHRVESTTVRRPDPKLQGHGERAQRRGLSLFPVQAP